MIVGKYTNPNFDQSVLITVDTQNDFTLDGAPAEIVGTAKVIPNMVRLLESYRKRCLPIIHMVRLYQPDGSNVDMCRKEIVENGKEIVSPNSFGAELVSELKPDSATRLDANTLLSGEAQQIGENEYIMYKPRWGAFYGTRLDELLRFMEVDTLVFSGCNYPNCPRTSIYEASERDYRLVLAKDAMSQLYSKGEEEMNNIGVSLRNTEQIEAIIASL